MPLTDTAVTVQQAKLLDLAVAETEALNHPIVEVGSYRGVNTLRFAHATRRKIYAVDPFIGYGGSERDLVAFEVRTAMTVQASFAREAVVRNLAERASRLLKNPVVSCSDSSSEEIWKNKDESRGPYAKSTERQNSPVKVSNKGLK